MKSGHDDDAYRRVVDDNTEKAPNSNDYPSAMRSEWKDDHRKSKPVWPITPYMDNASKKALHEYKYAAEDQ